VARSDLLLSIVRAGATGDRDALRSSVEAVVAEERGKNHHILADRLQRALNTVSVAPPAAPQPGGQAGKDTILETIPRRRIEELILPLPVSESQRGLGLWRLKLNVAKAIELPQPEQAWPMVPAKGKG